MNLNREDVVQSALNVQRWCEEHISYPCNCPFVEKHKSDGALMCRLTNWRIVDNDIDVVEPYAWGLDEFLRTRGVKDGN